MIRNSLKWLGSLVVYPLVALYRMGLIEFGSGGCLLALVPGGPGRLWRRRWYELTLARCGKNLFVDWMGVIKTPRTRLGDNVFIGTSCWIGFADIGNDVMFGGHITLLSGKDQHHFDRLDVPIAKQGGTVSSIKVGNDVWIGNRSVIMADIATGTVVGAGSVVTKTFEANHVLTGVPAKPLRKRGSGH